MAEFKGQGAPGHHVEGALGDTYIDERTGLKYRCIFAYASSAGNGHICEWQTTGERVDIKNIKRQTNQKTEIRNEKNDI